jgi:hypothetical protein
LTLAQEGVEACEENYGRLAAMVTDAADKLHRAVQTRENIRREMRDRLRVNGQADWDQDKRP